MKEKITESDMGRWFKEDLNEMFGEGFDSFANPPEGVRYGERLMYKNKSGAEIIRHEMTQQDIDEFNAVTADLAEACGGIVIPHAPPKTSGLPFPRFVDIKENDVFWGKGMANYIESEDILPTKNFDLEWALGLFFNSGKTLFFLDFTHPKVKGVFRFQYLRELDLPKYQITRQRFLEFILLLETYKNISNGFDPFNWVKVVQQDSKITIAIN